MRLKTTTGSKALTLVLLFVFAAVFLSAQDVQIRTRVDLVVVPVSVKGDDNDLISGLTQTDFSIYEDDVKQTIASFSIDPVPISAAVLIDTGVSEDVFRKVRTTFPSIVEAFSDFDEVTIYRFDRFITKLLDFTDNKLSVATSLAELKESEPTQKTFISSGPFNAIGPVIDGVPIIPGGRQPGPQVNPPGAELLNDAIFTAGEALATRQPDRRRIVFIISDGRANGDEHSFRETIDLLLDRGIEVFAIGIDDAAFSRRFSILNEYAVRTGGRACFMTSTHAMEECYARAVAEARNQYVLAYVSTNKPPDSFRIFREIDVRMTRPGLTARHRKGYFQYP